MTARVEIDVLEGKQVRRKEIVVHDGDDLEELTKRAIYADCRIGEIRAGRDNQLLEVKLPGSETFIRWRDGWTAGQRFLSEGLKDGEAKPASERQAKGRGRATKAAEPDAPGPALPFSEVVGHA